MATGAASRWRQITTNLALASVSLAVALLGAELFVRAARLSPKAGESSPATFVEYDSLLGWRKIPDLRGVEIRGDLRIVQRFNSRGLRTPEYRYEKPSRVLRILALGDSYAEGYTVQFSDLFSRVLERTLARSGVASQVVNAGTRGYSTDQELLFFVSEGHRYQPDVTVLLFHDNDVWYNAQLAYPRGPKPRYLLEEGELVLTNVPPPRVERRGDGEEAESNDAPLSRLKRSAAEHSHLYRFIRDRVKSIPALHDVAIAVGLADRSEATAGGRPLPDVWRVFSRDPGPEIESAWKLTEALVLRLQQEVATRGGRLLLFYVPSRHAVDPEAWRRFRDSYDFRGDPGNPNSIRQRLADLAERKGIHFLDSSDVFREGAKDLYAADGHWNAAGHRLAARLMARWILERRANVQSTPSDSSR